MLRLAFASPSLLLILASATAACGGSGSGADAPWDGDSGELEFAGEQPFLPGLDIDTGWLPEESEVAVRATASATGKVAVVAKATSEGDTLTPVAGSGALSLEGALGFEVSTRIDTAGIMYEGIVGSFEYGIEPASESFDPFALDAPVTVMSALPAQELGKVPIPSVPGASLVMSVTGGDLITAFQGTCAEARDGFAQYAGTITMSGTVACAASVEIEVPIVGTQTFGPFPFDVPIPAIESPTDLGTLSLESGEPGAAMGICDGSTSATDDGTAGDDTAGDDVADSGDDVADSGGDASSGDGGTFSTDTSTDDTSTNPADPDYPMPDAEGACPVGYLTVKVGGHNPSTANAVCLPPCEIDADCPTGATGEAMAFCAENPGSSYSGCVDDSDCVLPEHCDAPTCQLPPTHCVLRCDFAACPDEMTCLSGVCTYLF